MWDLLGSFIADFLMMIVVTGLCAIPLLIVISALSPTQRPSRYYPRRIRKTRR